MNSIHRLRRFLTQDRERWRVLHGAAWMLSGLWVRFVFQFVTFLLLARVLKAENYGLFAGSLGLVASLAPFALWGSGHILVQEVARDPQKFSRFWGHATTTAVLSGLLLLAIATFLGWWILPHHVIGSVLLPLAIGEFFGNRGAELAGRAFQAHRQLSVTSRLYMAIAGYRFLAVMFLLFPGVLKTAQSWALLYLLAGLSSGITGMLTVWIKLRPQRFLDAPLWNRWGEGLYFSIGQASHGAYSELDKSLLLHWVSPAVVGTYAVAQRLIGIAFLPLQALFSATYPEFFHHGGRGVRHAIRYARRWLPLMTVLAVLLGIGAVVGAPVLLHLIGKDYTGLVIVTLGLSPLLLLRVLHFVAGDILTGSGYQRIRSLIQVLAVALSVGLNVLLIPVWGWKGAVVTALVTNALLGVFLWGTALWKQRAEMWASSQD